MSAHRGEPRTGPCCLPDAEPCEGDAQATSEAPGPDLAGLLSARPPMAHRVRLPGGTFRMGSDEGRFPDDHEGPVRHVEVDPFAIDACAVDNVRFARFVDASGHRTDAERRGGSYVFFAHLPPGVTGTPVPGLPWWRFVDGASWHRPEGPGSGLRGRERHPVVHVSWRDARAYAAWVGGRLPREHEWEYAARAGHDQRRFPWGDELEPGGRHLCNVWQGAFPEEDLGLDGHRGTAPVDAYPPNDVGLYGVVGNVWEWCADRFAGRSPDQRVQKGGSYLCHASYCDRYRVGARSSSSEDGAYGHAGLRVAYDA